jgi:hypothetical protein
MTRISRHYQGKSYSGYCKERAELIADGWSIISESIEKEIVTRYRGRGLDQSSYVTGSIVLQKT